MRQPIQVLVFLYRQVESEIEYLILYRADMKTWQGVAGGVEANETPFDAALRESAEETGVTSLQLLELESHCTIPAEFVTGFLWGQSVLVVKELAFGLQVATDFQVSLSDEHTDYQWCLYDDAKDLLVWDSNRNALWELNHRLTNRLQNS